MNERKVDVYLDDGLVGTLAETADRRVAFAYSDAWLESGFAISPFSLPVEQKVFVPSSRTFHGQWGVFADSLPDAWGRLLVDRMLQSRGLSPADVTPLERLAIVGASGMGALTYVGFPAIVMKRFDLNKNCVTDQKEFKDNTAHTPFRVRIFCPIIPFS